MRLKPAHHLDVGRATFLLENAGQVLCSSRRLDADDEAPAEHGERLAQRRHLGRVIGVKDPAYLALSLAEASAELGLGDAGISKRLEHGELDREVRVGRDHHRFTRLTNAFSKKFESHAHMVALYTVWYNFVRVHKTLRVSPAMAAGVTDRLWSMQDVAALLEAAEAPAKKQGPYKGR